jgi:hypothetical protein
MKVAGIFRQYIWLVNTIHRARRITLSEINERWVKTELSGGMPMHRSLFSRHRKAIEEMFELCIECERRGNEYFYYIENEEVLENNNLEHWMLDSLSVGNLLMESSSLRQRIRLDSIPAGKMYLEPIIHAMKLNHKLRMTYRKFDHTGYSITIEPYAIKVFKQRWYLVANDYKRNHPSIYAFDRIVALEETEEEFVYPTDFDIDEFLKDCFGVLYTDDKPQRIVVRAYKPLTSYLRTLPLHHSQKELHSTDRYADFEYYLRPTFDFRQELLSQGEEIEILEPESFRYETAALHERILKRYKRG